jgi:hypothetical protein
MRNDGEGAPPGNFLVDAHNANEPERGADRNALQKGAHDTLFFMLKQQDTSFQRVFTTVVPAYAEMTAQVRMRIWLRQSLLL